MDTDIRPGGRKRTFPVPGDSVNREMAKWAIDSVWRGLDTFANRNTDLVRIWTELNDATVKNEKEHRTWLRPPSFKENHPRACSIKLAARYFAAIAPFREYEVPKSWLEVARTRADWRLGHAFQECMIATRNKPNEPTYWEMIQESGSLSKPIEILKLVEYGRDLVR